MRGLLRFLCFNSPMTVGDISVQTIIDNAKTALADDAGSSNATKDAMSGLILVVELLANKFKLNSKNSSKPPSTDTKGKNKNTEKKKSERPRGGQVGHTGMTLQKVENPDEIIELKIDESLKKKNFKIIGYVSRQVIDLKISRYVIEYRAEQIELADGKIITANFPESASKAVQYGAEVKANCVYLSQYQMIPFNRICDFFIDSNISLSEGTVSNIMESAYDRLGIFNRIARDQLLKSSVNHADETGININGKLHWLHVLSNESWAIIYPHAKRGSVAFDEINLIPNYDGTLVHDGFKAYFKYGCEHSLCNAHHLRELEWCIEQNLAWAEAMKELFLEIKNAVSNSVDSLPAEQIKNYSDLYDTIVDFGSAEMTGDKEHMELIKKAINLHKRFIKYKSETLLFMHDPDVPFTNNQGERDIRMTKVKEKISGCFRSMNGAKYFCRIRSYLLTCQKHGVAPMAALRLLFSNDWPDFIKNYAE